MEKLVRCRPKIIKKVYSDDVYYKGPYLPQIGVTSGTSLTNALISINDALKNLPTSSVKNEIIPIENTSEYELIWNSERRSKFGESPIIDLYTYVQSENLYVKSETTILTDVPPPYISKFTIKFSFSVRGYLVIS